MNKTQIMAELSGLTRKKLNNPAKQKQLKEGLKTLSPEEVREVSFFAKEVLLYGGFNYDDASDMQSLGFKFSMEDFLDS